MIKINLLPTKRKKKAKPLPTFIVAGVMVLVLSIVASVLVVYFLNSRVEALEAQKQANQQKLAELEQRMKEVEQFESLNNTFQERKKIIEELTKNQSVPVRILDEVSKSLTQGVWLSSMNIARGVVSISGFGFSNSDIVTYVQSLKGDVLFTEVVLHNTSRTALEGVEVYTFSISFKVSA